MADQDTHTASTTTHAKTHRGWRSTWLWIIVAVLAMLVFARLMLPHWVTSIVNRRLDRMGDYHGHIEGVDIDLWRCAYEIEGLAIVKRTGKVPVPLVDAPSIDLALSWSSLLHGGIVGDVVFVRPRLNFVDADRSSSAQSGAGVDWRAKLERLMPIRLDAVRVEDGTLHFRNFSSTPKVDLVAEHVDGVVTNLTNVRDAKGSRDASFDLHAEVLGGAPVESHARFDPLGALRDFRFAIKASKIELTRGNDFLEAYLHLDADSGSGDFVMQLESHDGKLDGYAKPLFHDVSIFSWKQDIERQHDNPLRALWEAVAGGIENLFKNQSADQFATRIPISGRIGDVDTDAWAAIVSILHNAFVAALKPRFENLEIHRGGEDAGD